MVQRGGRAGFLLEAAEAIGVGSERRGQDLDGDVAPEARVSRPIDLTHTPRANGGEDLVGAET
jgi:hypothetical protein